ncbi:MAG TPA: hypothetical protein VJN43_07040 [Bryobacteraceae bacterium]|nr:hypothetical protein [Bryobacteraceae bacterium]
MENQEETQRRPLPAATWGLGLVIIALCVITAVSLFYFAKERGQAQKLATANQSLNASMGQMQSQLKAVTDRLNALTAPQEKPPIASERPSALSTRPHARPAHRVAARRRAAEDPRFKKIESQLSDQQKQLASTRDEMAKNRQDLDGKLSSTRDELNGSISRTNDSVARTHDELVALEKRGERSYYEFTLDKSKQFQRVGPLSLSLRKVNYKHKAYNLALMVDDFKLDKKNINLYEPVWITMADRPQPVELVVNQVNKDQVMGYLSVPKYKKSELTASAAPAANASQTPAPDAKPAGDKTQDATAQH